jgi:DNA-binding LacI/PurR family transcriptional regulator/DNA-binding transcriptional regulator YhcF (GntR family)
MLAATPPQIRGLVERRIAILGRAVQHSDMNQLRILTASEQVAEHLRDELRRGTWTGVMPGEDRLMAQLGVGRNTIQAALRLLEEEGILAGKGAGHQRSIMPQEQTKAVLRVRILLYEESERSMPDKVELLVRLQEAGHAADFAPKTLQDLGMKVERVARFVEKNPADAWVVCSASREVLTWFSIFPVPAIAMYGRFTGVPIACVSPRKIPAMQAAVRKLVAWGHGRIVMIAREERRKPEPALFEGAFLKELAALGVPTGDYNLPNWEETPDGLNACLDTLFRHTPPTAIILTETAFFMSLQQYLSRRGIQMPDHLSLICLDPDPAFTWCKPTIAHIDCNYRPLVKRILSWADHVALGREDREQSLFPSKFVDGGTLGPVVI